MTINHSAARGRWVLCVLVLFWLQALVYATPYWTPEDYQRSRQAVFGPPEFVQIPPPDLVPLDTYSYLFEYFQICHFLSLWQVADSTSPDFGGMIEGETGSVASIIQTDNTQEAIRVWCRYAEMTGDLDTYRHNIDAAWVYTMNFPAYSEEGATDYYRVHNCGWGLVAHMKYLDVYGDPTYTEYADSCARYMQTHLLSFNPPDPFYQRLNPLVTGWAAGSLYMYGEYTGEQSYIDSALSMADRVIVWIEEDPSRLSTTEVWAMSGGTAMWGICASRFQEDPTYGQTWLATYGDYLDTWQATGEWNNSWNVWYAHAYHYMYDITVEMEFHQQAVSNVDMLLVMDTDNDGGIMATSTDPDTVDQTWVSCYLNWMGIAKIIDGLPDRDAGIVAVVAPYDTLPHMVGEPIAVTVVAGNLGVDPLGTVPVHVMGEYSSSATANLPMGGLDTVLFSPPWTPQMHGEFVLTAYTDLAGDEDRSNDSISIDVTVLAQSAIAGRVYDGETQDGISAMLRFYHHLYPPEMPFDTTATDPMSGYYEAAVPVGEYRVEVVPEYPYTNREYSGVLVEVGDTTVFDIELVPAPVVLVDDDGGYNFESWFLESLAELGVDSYNWDVFRRGSPGDSLQDFLVAVWFSGDESGDVLTSMDLSDLEAFLDGGGNLLLTGQDLEACLEGTAFLTNYLHAEIGAYHVGSYMVNGVPDDPVSHDVNLLLTGAGGAQNQHSQGEVFAVTGGVEFLNYSTTPPRPGGVRFDGGTYKAILLTFGLEAVSGVATTTTREEFLHRALQWFDPQFSVPETVPFVPLTASLGQNYPNPFNVSTVIPFEVPVRSVVWLVIYNILGQRVRVLANGQDMLPGLHRMVWDGCDGDGQEVSSGVYIYQAQAGEYGEARKMVVLR
jgi:hypothetical protein